MEPFLQIIGIVHSSLQKTEDCPLQENENAPEAIFEVYEQFMEGIKDIQVDDELILFTWLHHADRTVLKTHPRNDPNVPFTGIFSTRSPDRPNPIGIHFVRVAAILTNRQFKVSGLEVLDQTPVVDIKPDLKSFSTTS